MEGENEQINNETMEVEATEMPMEEGNEEKPVTHRAMEVNVEKAMIARDTDPMQEVILRRKDEDGNEYEVHGASDDFVRFMRQRTTRVFPAAYGGLTESEIKVNEENTEVDKNSGKRRPKSKEDFVGRLHKDDVLEKYGIYDEKKEEFRIPRWDDEGDLEMLREQRGVALFYKPGDPNAPKLPEDAPEEVRLHYEANRPIIFDFPGRTLQGEVEANSKAQLNLTRVVNFRQVVFPQDTQQVDNKRAEKLESFYSHMLLSFGILPQVLFTSQMTQMLCAGYHFPTQNSFTMLGRYEAFFDHVISGRPGLTEQQGLGMMLGLRSGPDGMRDPLRRQYVPRPPPESIFEQVLKKVEKWRAAKTKYAGAETKPSMAMLGQQLEMNEYNALCVELGHVIISEFHGRPVPFDRNKYRRGAAMVKLPEWFTNIFAFHVVVPSILFAGTAHPDPREIVVPDWAADPDVLEGVAAFMANAVLLTMKTRVTEIFTVFLRQHRQKLLALSMYSREIPGSEAYKQAKQACAEELNACYTFFSTTLHKLIEAYETALQLSLCRHINFLAEFEAPNGEKGSFGSFLLCKTRYPTPVEIAVPAEVEHTGLDLSARYALETMMGVRDAKTIGEWERTVNCGDGQDLRPVLEVLNSVLLSVFPESVLRPGEPSEEAMRAYTVAGRPSPASVVLTILSGDWRIGGSAERKKEILKGIFDSMHDATARFLESEKPKEDGGQSGIAKRKTAQERAEEEAKKTKAEGAAPQQQEE